VGESQAPRAAPQPQVSPGHSKQPSKDSEGIRVPAETPGDQGDQQRPQRPIETLADLQRPLETKVDHWRPR